MFKDDFEANGKAAMHEHYLEIRSIAERTGRPVLEMGLGDGWAPLCAFLGVDVPLHPFPRMNEGGDWLLKMRRRSQLRAQAAALRFVRFSLPLAIAGMGALYARRTELRWGLPFNNVR